MKNNENVKWNCIGIIGDGVEFKIYNINVWDFYWESTGKTITVKDPNYKANYKANLYKITSVEKIIEFAAIEFSNCIWGFYLKWEP